MNSLEDRKSEKMDSQLLKEMESILGSKLMTIVKKEKLFLEVFRTTPWLYGKPELTIAFVGVTRVGKTTLINSIFDKEIYKIQGLPDTTGRVARLILPSGIALVDTPGLGGFKPDLTKTTLAYLGIRPWWQFKKLKSLKIENVDTRDGMLQSEKEYIFGKEKPPAPDFIIFVISVKEYRHDDLNYYKKILLQNQGILVKLRLKKPLERSNLLLVANKSDQLKKDPLSSEKHLGTIKEKFGQKAILVSATEKENLNQFVQEVVEMLPAKSVGAFNKMVEDKYRITRNEKLMQVIFECSAEAALTNVSQKSTIENISRFELILRGLMLRITLDFYGISGTERIKKEVSPMIHNIYQNVKLKRIVEETKVNQEVKYKKVKDWVWEEIGDHTVEGALAGVASGAAIGTAAAPGVGTVIGGLLGLIFGTALGSGAKKKEFVEIEKTIPKIVNVTKVIKVPKQGGREAASSMMAFGIAYLEMLNKFEQGKTPSMEYFLKRYKSSKDSCEYLLQDVEEEINKINNPSQMREMLFERLSGINVSN